MESLNSAVWTCLAVCAVAAGSDLATRKIPNLLTLGGIVVGLALHGAVGFVDAGWQGLIRGISHSLLGLILCSAFPLFSFARGEMGGGDVKLFAAIGTLCGPTMGFDAQTLTFLVTITFVLPWRLIRQRALMPSLRNAWISACNAVSPTPSRREIVAVKLAPVVMGPTILVGLCLAIARRGLLP